jgi:hypothetical protein
MHTPSPIELPGPRIVNGLGRSSTPPDLVEVGRVGDRGSGKISRGGVGRPG